MKKKAIFFLPLLILFSCQSSGNRSNYNNASEEGDATTVLTAKNAILDSVPADLKNQEWQSIFNGKDLTGWRGFKNKPLDAWDVGNGILYCDGHKKGVAHTDLITDKQYKNFVLSLKWKISPESNSGIMFHVTEDQPRTSLTGPEYQLIDDKGWSGKLEPWQHTGSNYAMQVTDPDSVSINPVGEWNTSKILVSGAHVEHWLNGKRILQYQLWSPEWEKQKAAGKWKNADSYGRSKTGHIALQYHGGDVWFKDIKIKTL